MERENELRGLIEKANESSGGAVIGSLAYRSDYESVLAEEKLLQRTAAEKIALSQRQRSSKATRRFAERLMLQRDATQPQRVRHDTDR